MMVQTILAKALWNGDRFSLVGGEGMYVIKTHKADRGYASLSRAERRLTSMTAGFLGLGKRWKLWTELDTPIEEQALGQEVIKANP